MTTGSSKWIRRARRLAIYSRDRFRCVWCTRTVWTHDGTPADWLVAPDCLATLDHVRPRKDGGTHKTENLVTACAKCNAERRDANAYAFAVYLCRTPRGAGDSPGSMLARVIAAITRPLPGRKLDGRAAAVTRRHVSRPTTKKDNA
jgi:hypothetical protein